MRSLMIPALLLSAVIGCAESTPATTGQSAADSSPAVETVNAYCPIMGGKVTAKGGTTEWNDQTIGFCCPGCDSKWEALSDEEKAAKLAAADEESNGQKS